MVGTEAKANTRVVCVKAEEGECTGSIGKVLLRIIFSSAPGCVNMYRLVYENERDVLASLGDAKTSSQFRLPVIRILLQPSEDGLRRIPPISVGVISRAI